MKIRPVSDLRNKYPEIEAGLNENGSLFLTKNGYGTAVLMNIDDYMRLNESVQPLANYSTKTNIVSKDKPKSKSGLGLLSSYADMVEHGQHLRCLLR